MSVERRAVGSYLLFGLVGLGLLMSSINLTIVAVALPAMTRSLDTSLSWVGWTLTAYQLVMVVVLPLAGRLSDSLGRKRVFLFCVGTFTVGSLLCGLAPNIGWLIAFRVLQAVGGAGLMPSAVGIVSDRFEQRRSQFIGLLSSVLPIGTVIGPNLGGWIVQQWGWREVFFVNVPIGVLVLVGAAAILHDRRKPTPFQRFDYPGAALFATAMLAWMLALTWLGNDAGAWRMALFWLLLVGAGVLFWLFSWQERRTSEPIVEPGIAVRQPYLAAHLYNLFLGAASVGLVSLIPFYAVAHYGMSSVLSGVVLTPRSLVVIGVSTLSSMLLPRLGYRLPMLGGVALVCAGLIMLSLGWRNVRIGGLAIDDFWLVAVPVAVAGLGVGLCSPAAHNAGIELAPHKAAAISGIRAMFRNTGSIVTVSLIVLAMSLFEDRAVGLRVGFLVLALLSLTTVPLVLMLPDVRRERPAPGPPEALQPAQGG
jgi:EmrB/QacA subfamily drug resistance transporter